jgi:hypothetical protein
LFKNNYFLDAAYHKGYFKALLDVNNFFEKYAEPIKDFRLNNSKGARQILKALLDGRDALMEYGESADFTIVCDKGNLRTVKSLFIGEKPIQFDDNHNG